VVTVIFWVKVIHALLMQEEQLLNIQPYMVDVLVL